MNIKPFRNVNEYEVVNLYAYNGVPASKGTIVDLVTFNLVNPIAGWTSVPAGAQFNGTYSNRFGVNARVFASISGSVKVLGMMLYDVQDVDENGEPIRFLPKYKKDAMCVVESGQAVPILTRGIVEYSGFQGQGVPDAGSGAAVSFSGDGSIRVVAPGYTNPDRVGTFLSTTGVDGYALLKIEL